MSERIDKVIESALQSARQDIQKERVTLNRKIETAKREIDERREFIAEASKQLQDLDADVSEIEVRMAAAASKDAGR